MAVAELKLNPLTSNVTVDNKIVENTEYIDKSEMLFNYMNMIAFNNKVDLKLN